MTQQQEAPAPADRFLNVIEALACVMRDLPAIGKDSKASAQQGGYAYRGIEAITKEAQPLFAKYGVVFVPRVVSHEIRDIVVNDKPWTDTIVLMEYDVYGPGGTEDKIVVGPILAIGRDNSDKGANKCQPAGTLVRVPTEIPNGGKRTFAGWTEVPIESVRTGDHVVTWKRRGSTQAVRGRKVERVGVRPYDGPLMVVRVGERVSRYTLDHLCLVGWGTGLDEGNHVVYMMRRGTQYRIGRTVWAGTPQEGRTRPERMLQRRARSTGADAAWVLSVHATVEDAALAEALAAVRFGLPQCDFVHTRGRRAYTFSLPDFWQKLGDNMSQASDCLVSHGLSIAAPLLEARNGSFSWLSEDGVAAGNLRSGMVVPVPCEARGWNRGPVEWQPIEVSREWYSGLVYSLDVEDEHNYIADGIVTHNCATQALKYALIQTLCISDAKDDSDHGSPEADAPAPPAAPEVGSPEHEYRRRNLAFRNIKDAIGDDPDRRAKAKEVADRLGIVLAEAGASETEAVAAAVIRFFETGELPPEATPREPAPTQGAAGPESEASGPDEEPTLAERIRQQAGATSWTPNLEERQTAHDAWGEHPDAAHHDTAIKEARANLVLSIVEVIAANEWDEPRVRVILGAGPRKSVPKAVAEARLGDLRTTLDMLEAESPPPLDENPEGGQS